MFRVEWLQSALDELALLWMQADASVRQAITVAAHQIDQQLQTDPYQQGETRPGGQRIHFVVPLGLTFRIEQDEQTISVLHVWRFDRRPR